MEKKPKFNIGDTAYYIKNSMIKKGEVTAIITHGNKSTWYEYQVDRDISSDDFDMFNTKSEALKIVLAQLYLDTEKVDLVCKILFPDEYVDELTDEDFEKLEKPEEPLQIEEKTSFWKGLFK